MKSGTFVDFFLDEKMIENLELIFFFKKLNLLHWFQKSFQTSINFFLLADEVCE